MKLEVYRNLAREEQVRLGAEALALAAAVTGRTVVRSSVVRKVRSKSKAKHVVGNAKSWKTSGTVRDNGFFVKRAARSVAYSHGRRGRPKKAG